MRQETPAKAVIVGSPAEAEAALRAAAALGRPVLLLSPPDAAGYCGAPWFLALVARARAAVPGATAETLLDCGESAGAALAALDSGAQAIALAARPALRRRIARLAAAGGARLAPWPREALDLRGTVAPERLCHAFLAAP